LNIISETSGVEYGASVAIGDLNVQAGEALAAEFGKLDILSLSFHILYTRKSP
jgi:hypothetical protein